MNFFRTLLILLTLLFMAKNLTASNLEKGKDLVSKGNYSSAKSFLTKACKNNNGEACLYIGQMYQFGLGFIKDDKKAGDYILKSCELKHGEACFSIAKSIQSARYPVEKFAAYFEHSCNLDYANGCMAIASLINDAKLQKEFFDKGIALSEKECQKNPDACFGLARLYEGNEKQKSQNFYTKAFKLYKSECDKGYINSCKQLADFYINGISTQKDVNKAKKALKVVEKSCNKGNDISCFSLINNYKELKDTKKRLEFAKKSCELNNYNACEVAALIYANDYKKPKKAETLFLKAGIAYGREVMLERIFKMYISMEMLTDAKRVFSQMKRPGGLMMTMIPFELYKKGYKDESFWFYKQGCLKHHDSAVCLEMGRTFKNDYRAGKVLKEFKQGCVGKNIPTSCVNTAEVFARLDKKDEALEIYENICDKSPYNLDQLNLDACTQIEKLKKELRKINRSSGDSSDW